MKILLTVVVLAAFLAASDGTAQTPTKSADPAVEAFPNSAD